MCPSESKVVLNYDNVPGLENRYPGAVIQPYNPGNSHAKYYMADTVFMYAKKGMSNEQMIQMARNAAPLAEKVVIDGVRDGLSHDIPHNNAPFMCAYA